MKMSLEIARRVLYHVAFAEDRPGFPSPDHRDFRLANARRLAVVRAFLTGKSVYNPKRSRVNRNLRG
jgi:hypothetical protein